MSKRAVLIIYTGGTIGMVENEQGALHPLKFEDLLQYIPDCSSLNAKIDSIQFNPPIDSADMEMTHWLEIVRIIENNYEKYDGFVILHGTDTMTYTASALSFLLENIAKPVILTGSQLPLGKLRTDGKDNLLTALEIALDKNPDGSPRVPEVCILFHNELLRGNRTTKQHAEKFSAFRSYNYPTLADIAININYDFAHIHVPEADSTPKFHYNLDPNVVILRIFPTMSPEMVCSILSIPNLKGVVLETYGSGNSPNRQWFLQAIKAATERGIIILNVTQCSAGSVEMNRYTTGRILHDAGVISGYNITTEAAVAKLMFLLAQNLPHHLLLQKINTPIAGEFDV